MAKLVGAISIGDAKVTQKAPTYSDIKLAIDAQDAQEHAMLMKPAAVQGGDEGQANQQSCLKGPTQDRQPIRPNRKDANRPKLQTDRPY